MTCFIQNDVVSYTVLAKKKNPNGVVLNGIVGLLLPLDLRGRGRRRFFLPPVFTNFLPLKSIKKTLTKDPQLSKAFHVLKKREEMCPSSGGGAAAQWPPWPLSHLFFASKYRGDKERKKKRRKHKGEGGKPKRRT